MRHLAAFSVIAGLLAAGPAVAEVQVTFVDPRGFTDAALTRPGPVDAQAPALQGLRRILEREGRRLPPGRTLMVEVLDVDLAGEFPPVPPPGAPIRVMGPTTWPRISLRYALVQDGRRVAEGEEVVSDRTYLARAGAMRSGAPLRFEEPMLRDWFDTRFGAGRP